MCCNFYHVCIGFQQFVLQACHVIAFECYNLSHIEFNINFMRHLTVSHKSVDLASRLGMFWNKPPKTRHNLQGWVIHLKYIFRSLFVYVFMYNLLSRRQIYRHVKYTLCLIGGVICYLITIDHCSLRTAMKYQMAETSNCSLQPAAIICPTPQRTDRAAALQTASTRGRRQLGRSSGAHGHFPGECRVWHTDWKLFNDFHWRVKQQTESQCDCLSNEEIRALQPDWKWPGAEGLRVNKTLPSQIDGPLGACWSLQTPAKSKCLTDIVIIKPRIIIKMHQSDEANAFNTWIKDVNP